MWAGMVTFDRRPSVPPALPFLVVCCVVASWFVVGAAGRLFVLLFYPWMLRVRRTIWTRPTVLAADSTAAITLSAICSR